MERVLYIGAKAPLVGLAKTRLGRSIGPSAAATLYAAFLSDLAARFARAPFAVGWYITPADAWSDLAPLVGDQRSRILVQDGPDWTERQRRLFREAADRGETCTILVASDSPHLSVEVVADAFALLEQHDLVLGPVYDGGYYLIGMRGRHDILDGVPMSTGTVLQTMLARAEAMGLAVAQVTTTFDIDEVTDLHFLHRLVHERADLVATRAALEHLGLAAPTQPLEVVSLEPGGALLG